MYVSVFRVGLVLSIIVIHFANINILRRSIGGDIFHDLREVYVKACSAILSSHEIYHLLSIFGVY